MRASLEWLREYVDIDVSAEELAEKLTASGIAVEGVEEVDGDRILVLELTPNRGDCYGMLNLAREVAAVTGRKVRVPQTALTENQEDINDYVRVRIEAPELCARYAARLVKNVRVEPSPGWMQERLTRAGIRPINNIVDITNYVMLETNQPLHAFDYDLLKGRQIIVRRAAPGEKLVTLDEVERELDEEMLVIADSERAVALAGVMGGRNTEISDSTGTILLESANFLAASVRGTSRRLGLRTEASLRFEKGADVFGIIRAVDRAAQLIGELGAGEVVRGVCD
ncbi:MAG: phenylalanine--tRNA ligase subunit beta, partial [Syntrophomonadaceae bacterium]|nr:phenylalanine--tRNA ligase subunit beta [Syntrophomonadaceae bacterium]